MKKIILTILICGIIALSMTGCGKSSINNAKENLEVSYEKYGFVEKETVDILVAKFNTEVVDNTALNLASTDYLTEDNNQYWYGLNDGIYLVVVPEKYTGDKTTDIVDYMLIYLDKTSKYEEDAVIYAKNLIKANYNAATETEIITLLEKAKSESTTGKTAYNGKGISVGCLDKDNYYQYQVLRFYK